MLPLGSVLEIGGAEMAVPSGLSPGTQGKEAGYWGWGPPGGGPGSGFSLDPSFHHGCIPSEINKGSVGAQ